MLSKVCVFIDVKNQFYTINKKWNNRKLNYEKYLDKCKQFGEISRAFAYGTQIDKVASKFISCLHHIGYEPNFKEIEQHTWYCWDVGITIEIVNQITHKRCDVIILGTSNRTLIPAILWAKAQGIRVIVMGCGIHNDIREACDEWVEIKEDMLEVSNAITETAE